MTEAERIEKVIQQFERETATMVRVRMLIDQDSFKDD